MIRSLKEIESKVDAIRLNGRPKGKEVGFKCLNDNYTVKPDSYTIVLGAPAHGKSEFIFEILLNLAVKYGDISLIYSPETGGEDEVYAELLAKYMKIQKIDFFANDKLYHQAKSFIMSYFYVIDDEISYSYNELVSMVESYQKKFGIKFNNIMAEPYNELKHDMSKFGTRQDIYIEEFMSSVRRSSRRNNFHTFLSFHPGGQSQVVDEDTKTRYYPMPKAREAAGGQATLRKAMMWINLWRPQKGLKDENGMPYEDNQVIVHFEKVKPKHYGNRGVCSLFYDWRKSRYYEKINGKACYAFEHELDNKEDGKQFVMPVSEMFNELTIEKMPF